VLADPEEVKRLVAERRGFVFDLDGTVYLGDELIPGAREAVNGLRRAGKRLAFVSNKPIGRRDDYARKLNRLGIQCARDEVITSSLVLARYLQRTAPGAQVYPIAEGAVIQDLEAHGLAICHEVERIEVVAISWGRGFNYEKLNTAYRAALRGARLVATNPDRTCPMPGYELPDCACMIAAIEACTQMSVDPIVGKPSPIMLHEVLAFLELEPHECAMVGDRPDTDLLMADRAGLAGVLVLTGVGRAEDAARLSNRPLVLESVARIAGAL